MTLLGSAAAEAAMAATSSNAHRTVVSKLGASTRAIAASARASSQGQAPVKASQLRNPGGTVWQEIARIRFYAHSPTHGGSRGISRYIDFSSIQAQDPSAWCFHCKAVDQFASQYFRVYPAPAKTAGYVFCAQSSALIVKKERIVVASSAAAQKPSSPYF